jgi:hypothetical protein
LILLHFRTASEASRDFCAAGAICFTKSLEKLAKVAKVSSKKKKKIDML